MSSGNYLKGEGATVFIMEQTQNLENFQPGNFSFKKQA